MRVLFVSRAYPPVIGGIEKQNFEICQALSAKAELVTIINRRGKRFLLPFFLRACFQSLRLRGSYDAVLLGDGVLAPLALFIKLFRRVPVLCIVHGLDITYRSRIYQTLWIGVFFRFIDRFIAVGSETIRQAEVRGMTGDRFSFIPNGVNTAVRPVADARQKLLQRYQLPDSAPVLLTLGRLVERKGVAWFIREVLPGLDPATVYLVAGTGPDLGNIELAVRDSGCGDRVKLLGEVSEDDKHLLLSGADIFVQPNIPVAHDMEGFGLVVLEAALYGTVVVASRLEGLKDAVVDGSSGILVEPGNAGAFVELLSRLLDRRDRLAGIGEQAHRYVMEHCGWEDVAGHYLAVIAEELG